MERLRRAGAPLARWRCSRRSRVLALAGSRRCGCGSAGDCRSDRARGAAAGSAATRCARYAKAGLSRTSATASCSATASACCRAASAATTASTRCATPGVKPSRRATHRRRAQRRALLHRRPLPQLQEDSANDGDRISTAARSGVYRTPADADACARARRGASCVDRRRSCAACAARRELLAALAARAAISGGLRRRTGTRSPTASRISRGVRPRATCCICATAPPRSARSARSGTRCSTSCARPRAYWKARGKPFVAFVDDATSCPAWP